MYTLYICNEIQMHRSIKWNKVNDLINEFIASNQSIMDCKIKRNGSNIERGYLNFENIDELHRFLIYIGVGFDNICRLIKSRCTRYDAFRFELCKDRCRCMKVTLCYHTKKDIRYSVNTINDVICSMTTREFKSTFFKESNIDDSKSFIEGLIMDTPSIFTSEGLSNMLKIVYDGLNVFFDGGSAHCTVEFGEDSIIDKAVFTIISAFEIEKEN